MDAKYLLKECSKDSNRYIMRLGYMDGIDITMNNKNIVKEKNPREIAKWEAVVKELELLELIESINYKREIFKITNKGYAVADSIKNI